MQCNCRMDVRLGVPERDEGNARVMKFVARWPIGVPHAGEGWRDTQRPNQQNIMTGVRNFFFHNNDLSVK